MSSGILVQPNAGRNLSMAVGGQVMNRIGRLGLSPRQQELNRLWCYYTCEQYSARTIDWNGNKYLDHIEREAIASADFIPPGFYDAAASLLPLNFRRPTSPYHLTKVIVERFTSLLFSQKRHPKFQIDGDEISEDFLNTVATVGRLWPTMIQARTFGGAMGSSCVGFQFINGKPRFEVHDPRWAIPIFEDRMDLTLAGIDKRYIYPVEVRDEDGVWHEEPFWYRRVIDKERDVIYKPAPVGDGDEPFWEESKVVEHKLGFCPAVWIQNIPVVGDVDGLSDCHGCYDMVESIDALNASAQRGIIANCDPTLVISTDAEMDRVKKGNDNAIKLPGGGNASYMEIAATGPKAARELASDFRKLVLEVAQCHLETEGSVPQTATEVERKYASMLSKADVMREQYGEHGIKPLMEKTAEAVKKLASPRRSENGIVRYYISIPPRLIQDENGEIKPVNRSLGKGPHYISVQWQRYFEPDLKDVDLAVRAAAAAKTAQLVDDLHSTRFIAEYFNISDVGALVEKIKEEAAKVQKELERMSLTNMDGGEF